MLGTETTLYLCSQSHLLNQRFKFNIQARSKQFRKAMHHTQPSVITGVEFISFFIQAGDTQSIPSHRYTSFQNTIKQKNNQLHKLKPFLSINKFL